MLFIILLGHEDFHKKLPALMSSNFGNIPSPTTDLTAFGHLKKNLMTILATCFLTVYSSFLQVTMTALCMGKFEYRPDPTSNYKVSCLESSSLQRGNVITKLAPSFFYESFSFLTIKD